jgi:membrane-associated phospholipid phosphatase
VKNSLTCVGLSICLLAATLPARGQVLATKDRAGDALRVLVPAAAAALTFYEEDREGLKELAYSFALSQGATEVLKRTVRSKRPDGSGMGFPSGHASGVFSAAAFVHERYGVAKAIPFYGLATLTAYSRVHRHHHFTRDVVGGAVVGIASSFLLTHPREGRASAGVGYGPEGVTLHFATSW